MKLKNFLFDTLMWLAKIFHYSITYLQSESQYASLHSAPAAPCQGLQDELKIQYKNTNSCGRNGIQMHTQTKYQK